MENKDVDYNGQQVEESLEVLRAKYLGKRIVNRSTQSLATSERKEETSLQEEESLDALRQKYKKQKTSTKEKKYRSKFDLICDGCMLVAILIICITSCFWFATPTMEIGGVVYQEKTKNVFSFLFGADNSVVEQIKAAVKVFSELEAETEEIMGAINSVMKLFRLIFLMASGGMVLLNVFVLVLFAPIFFFLKKSNFLRGLTVYGIMQNLTPYVLFVFFGSISGGEGIDFYYIGYRVGTGMTVGLLVAIGILLTVSVVAYCKVWKKTIKAAKNVWFCSLCSALGYTGIAVVLTLMPLYSVFMYTLTSSLTAALSNVVSGFQFKALIFPCLNLFLFVVALILMSHTQRGFQKGFAFLLNFETIADQTYALTDTSAKKLFKVRGFVPVIILGGLSVLAVCILNNPTYGYGWSVDIYGQCVWIFMIACIGQSFFSFFKNTEPKKTNKAAKINPIKETDLMEETEEALPD